MVSLRTGQAQSDVLMGRVTSPSGTLTWISINCRAARSARRGDAPTPTVTSFTDITDRLLAERELRAE